MTLELAAPERGEQTREVSEASGKGRYELEPTVDQRPAYAPTPLAPWEAVDKADTLAVSRSFEVTSAKLDQALGRNNYPAPLREMMEIAVGSAVTDQAIENNRSLQYVREQLSELPPGQTDEYLLKKALSGNATQRENLRLAMQLPVPSLELAKVSHPGNHEDQDTRRMEEFVTWAIKSYGAEAWWTDGGNYRYGTISPNDTNNPKAVMFMRKNDVATIRGNWSVVRKSGFVIRLDGELSEDEQPPEQLRRSITGGLHASDSHNQRQQAIEAGLKAAASANIIEAALAKPPEERPAWLVPTVTSYYCKNLAVEAKRAAEVETVTEPVPEALRESIGQGATGHLRCTAAA